MTVPPRAPQVPVVRQLVPLPRFWLLSVAVVAVVAMAVVSVIALRNGAELTEESNAVVRMRVATREVVADALAAESSLRGYLLTGEDHYLSAYREWEAGAPLVEVRAVAAGRYEAALDELEAFVEGKRKVMRSTLARYDAGDPESAYQMVASDSGKVLMQQARQTLDGLIAREDARFASVASRFQDTSTLAIVVVVSGTGLAVLALVVGLVSLRADTHRLGALAASHAEQAARLEEQGAALGDNMKTLAQANRALRRSNRDLDQFAYVASHDLKAPLRAISSLSTWIEEDLGEDADATIREHLRLMRSRIERMDNLIEGILGYSRADRQLEASEIDTRAVVEEVCDQLAPPDNVEISIEPGPWPRMVTPRVQFAQVWSNLIANALKHGSPGGGRIELGCARDPRGAWAFSVADHGPGIDPAYHTRVFEMFQRLASRDRVEGAGIGLTIVRKLVDANGGAIRIDSTPGDGARFIFTWGPA